MVSFRRLDAKIWDVQTLDAKNLGPETPGRQKRCHLDANFFNILSGAHPKETRNKETSKKENKKKAIELLKTMIIFRNRHAT